MSLKDIFERSETLFDEYLSTVSAEEFLALYDACETYEGLTVDKWLAGSTIITYPLAVDGTMQSEVGRLINVESVCFSSINSSYEKAANETPYEISYAA